MTARLMNLVNSRCSVLHSNRTVNMEGDSLVQNSSFLESSGVVFSAEQKATLQTSLAILKSQHKFKRVRLWGMIKGIKKNYFIAQGIGNDETQDRKYLYSQDCLNWAILPPADGALMMRAGLLRGRFSGDPSFVYEHTVSHRTGEGEGAHEETTTVEMKEEDRLAAVVATIEEEVGIVPQGAVMKTPTGVVKRNNAFEGLSLGDAQKLSQYLLLREPVHDRSKELASRKTGVNKTLEFLDSIESDIPKGCWSVQLEDGSVAVLRNLVWLGYTFYHVPCTRNYGAFYCGTGERNHDLLFML